MKRKRNQRFELSLEDDNPGYDPLASLDTCALLDLFSAPHGDPYLDKSLNFGSQNPVDVTQSESKDGTESFNDKGGDCIDNGMKRKRNQLFELSLDDDKPGYDPLASLDTCVLLAPHGDPYLDSSLNFGSQTPVDVKQSESNESFNDKGGDRIENGMKRKRNQRFELSLDDDNPGYDPLASLDTCALLDLFSAPHGYLDKSLNFGSQNPVVVTQSESNDGTESFNDKVGDCIDTCSPVMDEADVQQAFVKDNIRCSEENARPLEETEGKDDAHLKEPSFSVTSEATEQSNNEEADIKNTCSSQATVMVDRPLDRKVQAVDVGSCKTGTVRPVTQVDRSLESEKHKSHRKIAEEAEKDADHPGFQEQDEIESMEPPEIAACPGKARSPLEEMKSTQERNHRSEKAKTLPNHKLCPSKENIRPTVGVSSDKDGWRCPRQSRKKRNLQTTLDGWISHS